MTQKTKFGALALMVALVLIGCIALVVQPVSALAQTEDREIYYMDSSEIMPLAFTQDNETIAYDSKVVTENETGPTFPCFENTNGTIRNYCAPLAGTVLAGYYDRWYESLIPGYSTWTSFGPISIYSSFSSNTYIQSAFERLYELTKTNVYHDGTTEEEFVTGMNQYVDEKGLNISYNSVKQGNSIDLSLMDTYLDNEKPVLLLCETYNIITAIADDGEQVTLSKINSDVAHMMVAYGYEQYAYYKNGRLFRTDTYLKVSSGVNGGKLCYAKLNDDMDLVKAWAIDIYE